MNKAKAKQQADKIVELSQLNGMIKKMVNDTMQEMKARVKEGLDPLTGEKMETVGSIHFVGKVGGPGKCVDNTGKEVILNEKGTWIYK